MLAYYGLRSADILFNLKPRQFDEIESYPIDRIFGMEIYRFDRPLGLEPPEWSLSTRLTSATALVVLWAMSR